MPALSSAAPMGAQSQVGGPTAEPGPLRIGIMLRAIGEYDGAGVYIRKLLDALLEIDTRNEYVFFLANGEQRGRYAHRPNVREVVVHAPGKLLWDQVAVPAAAWRERLDVLFHHKFSIPALAPCPTVVQQRGTEYWRFPEYFPSWSDRLNRLYGVVGIPFFCRRAARVLTNSDSLASELERVAGVPPEKMATVYAAADSRFSRITDRAALARVRAQYGLPDQPFFLMVVKGYVRMEYSGQALCPRKNVEGALAAYARAREAEPNCPPMVILGPGVKDRLTPDVLLERFGLDRGSVIIPGLIAHDDMPELYSLAGALLFPSYYESFGIPLVEAMACGCPVITSSAPACPEVVGDAALVVDPDDVAGLERAMLRVVREPDLAAHLRERGLARARRFSWTESARRLLAELERASGRLPLRDQGVGIRVLAWPGARAANPYTRLLYSHLASLGVRVRDFTMARALRGGYDVFHVHWPEKALTSAAWAGAAAGAAAALVALEAAHLHGARIVWTAHNAQPHDSQHPRLESRFWSAFVRRVDAVIHLSAAGQQAVEARYPALATRPHATVPHGHFRGAYPDTISRDDARASLAISDRARVVAFLGLVRPYKNVPHLVRTARALADSAGDVVLLVAGAPRPRSLADEVRAAAAGHPRVRLVLEHIPDDQVQRYLRAADLVVLPFTDITNSGSALLALSFDRPVLVPALGSMGELRSIAGGDWVSVYEAELTPGVLAAALDWAVSHPRSAAPPLDALQWPLIARQTLSLYSEPATSAAWSPPKLAT